MDANATSMSAIRFWHFKRHRFVRAGRAIAKVAPWAACDELKTQCATNVLYNFRVCMLRTALFALAMSVALAQTPPAFDAASVKPTSPDRRNGGARTTRDGLIFERTTVKYCIGFAFHVRDYQISGPPGSMNCLTTFPQKPRSLVG
jgi:hypothetical protein